jgi:hypothetical protein
VGIAGNVQANERDKLKIANGGKFESYPDVKPRKYLFHLNFGYNSRPFKNSMFVLSKVLTV